MSQRLISKLNLYSIIIQICWVALVCCSLGWNIWNNKRITSLLAKAEAEANSVNDINYRLWASSQGGIYVPSEVTPPNPRLKTVAERDIFTPAGKPLTLVNPAYMLRLVHQMGNTLSLTHTKITSLHTLNPINNPDEWEIKALTNLKNTKKSYSEITTINSQPVLRHMSPFVTNNSCLKCHASQGVQNGEVRGGISQIIPLKKYDTISFSSLITTLPVHLFSLLFGILLINFGRRRIHYYANLHQIALKKSLANEVNLHLKNNELKQLNSSLRQVNEEYKHKNDELKNTRHALIHQHARLRAITLLNQSIIKAQDEEQLWSTITHILVRVLKYNSAAIFIRNDQSFSLVSCSHMDRNSNIEEVLLNYINGSPIIFSHPTIQLNPTTNSLMSMGLNHSLTIPIFINNELYAVVGIFTERDDAFKMLYDQIFLQRFSKQVTLGIHTLLLRKHRQHSDELIRLQNRELEHLIASRDKFFSILAHDLRNPFNTLIGISNLLKSNFDKYSNDKKKLFVNTLNEAAGKTLQLTENLLEWGRLQQSEVKTYKATVLLCELVAKSINDIETTAAQKNIKIQFQPSDSYEVMADPFMLRTVCRNILSNSIKFTPSGGTIIIEVARHNNMVQLSVKDNGIGISPEILPYIFQIEHKTSSIGTNGESGTGLGLILCNDMMMRQSGELTIESELQKGTKVTISLPLQLNTKSASKEMV